MTLLSKNNIYAAFLIKYIHFSNKLTDFGLQNLAESISKLTDISKIKLNLLGNQIHSQGSVILASELSKLQKLKILSLDFFRFYYISIMIFSIIIIFLLKQKQ